MDNSIGIIGGSGIYALGEARIRDKHILETPYGSPSDQILEIDIKGQTCFFLARHGQKHSYLPHEINYRANIFALKSIGVKYLVSFSAVGSLTEECPPGTFILPSQFLDWTKGRRERTFFGNGIVAHVSCANPISHPLKKILVNSCREQKIDHKDGGTYICIEGPQFSSRAESNLYRSLNATIIGMTNIPEAYLAKEAGIAYATVAMVTDFDCWKEEHCTVDQILKYMDSNNKKAQSLIPSMVENFYQNKFEFQNEIKDGILTPLEQLSVEKKKIVEVLMQ